MGKGKSTGEVLFNLGGEVVSWCSKKNIHNPQSIDEADYVLNYLAYKHAFWLIRFLHYLKVMRHNFLVHV